MGVLDRFLLDARLVGEFGRVLVAMRKARPEARIGINDFIDSHAQCAPSRPALIGEERSVSWGELDAGANRVARWARRVGLGCGDVVGLLMENRPEYVVTWLGLARVGVTTALLNTNLAGDRLAHCLREAAAAHLIVGAEKGDACASALPLLERQPEVWWAGPSAAARPPAAHDWDAALAQESVAALESGAREGLRTRDPLFYIYTSGTTGLPKAARFSHQRAIASALWCMSAQRLTSEDRVYDPLPLYHSAGGVMAAGGALIAGATLVIAPRFSASRFWSDCVKHEATSFQYIGELCRYLLNAPPSPDERRHRIRVCIGNGLRPEVWRPFQERFGIPRILEFYGATEGNVALMNFEGRVGAIGRLPAWLRGVAGIELVRFDVEREEVVRGADGHCIPCEPGETGETIGRITALNRFEGYTNAEATEKKILRNVFRRGDSYFRTGDLMRRDDDDFLYFVDRIGDTFRWKGENVSTGEVAEVLSVTPGVREANVYGVEVPGSDGRAGMAALVVDDDFDLEELARRVEAELASYARPLFLRILPEMDVTVTFKHRKVELVKQGFDPSSVSDPLYFRHPDKRRYVPLERGLYDSLAAGEIRV